jgi:uridine phosphorylase
MRERKDRTVFDPSDFHSYLAGRLGKAESEIQVPEDVVFTYDGDTFRTAIAETKSNPVKWYVYHDRLFIGSTGGTEVAIVHAMVGAPAAAMNIEELIAYGARRIFEVGLAGAIDARRKPGDIVILKGAFSDEGTSKHYYEGGNRFPSSPRLTRALRESLRSAGVEHTMGDAWTVDAPYRETVRKLTGYREMGAVVVNMESSAVFAVARYRGIEAASVQVVSDIVSEERWKAAFHHDSVRSGMRKALAAVLHVIRK